MWKRRIGWFSFALGLFFVFTLWFGARENSQPVNRAEAAVLVSDINNTLQNTKTAINTATTAINTATQIANQARNLASMSPDGLLAHYTGMSQELSNVVQTWQAYNGLMNANQTMQQSWNGAFKSVDSFFNGINDPNLTQRTTNLETTMRSLEKTYQDSLNSSKSISNMSQTGTALQTTLNNVANANGAKEVAQAAAQVNSLNVQEAIKTNQQLSNLVAIEAANGQSAIQQNAQALADNEKSTNDFTAAVTAQQSTVKSDTRNAAEKMGESADYVEFLKSRGLVK